MRHAVHVGFVVVATLGFAFSQGCGGDEPVAGGNDNDASSSSSSSSGESVSSSGGSSSGGSSSSGAAADAGGLPIECSGACREMALTITNGAKSGTFDRVQFGYGNGVLHVEAHRGGSPACPVQNSPTPDFTLILELPMPDSAAPVTRDDSLVVSFLDFQGNIDDTLPPPKVTTATLMPVAGRLGGDEQFFAFDIQAEFAQGATLSGHGFGTHCPSLDE